MTSELIRIIRFGNEAAAVAAEKWDSDTYGSCKYNWFRVEYGPTSWFGGGVIVDNGYG
jgi:hypothetical protein